MNLKQSFLDREQQHTKIIEHDIQQGETIQSIAQRFNVNPQNIIKLNGISDNRINNLKKIKIEVPILSKSIITHTVIENYHTKDNPENYINTLELIECFDVFFCTEIGLVQGVLTVSPSYVIFDPDVESIKQLEKQNSKNEKLNGKFNCQQFKARFDYIDLFLVDFRQVKLEKHEDAYEIYLDLMLDQIFGLNPPIKDAMGNYYIIKVSFKANSPFKALKQNFVGRTYMHYITEKIQYMIGRYKQAKIEGYFSLSMTYFYQLVDVNCAAGFTKTQTSVSYQSIISSQSLKESEGGIDTKDNLEEGKSNQDEAFSYQENAIKAIEKADSGESICQQVLPELHFESKIINKTQFAQIVQNIPGYMRLNDWYLLYAPLKHGISYELYLRKTESVGPHIIVVRDLDKVVFGAFVTESWKKTNLFYGSGESFLFSFKGNSQQIKAYPWQKKDNFIQYCDETGISVGMGDRYGFYVNKEFMLGSSYPTDTFGNETLSGQPEFEIETLEVYCFDKDYVTMIENMKFYKFQ